MMDIARPKRGATPPTLTVLALALSACAHSLTVGGAAKAYAEGRYDEAEPALERLSEGSSPDAAKARKLLADLHAEQRLAASVLLEKAAALREGPLSARLQARSYLVLARSIVRGQGSEAAAADKAIAEIDAWRRQRSAAFDELRAKLVASESRCEPEMQANALSSLADLRRDLGRTESLLPPAVSAAAACFAAGRDLDVITLTELALELRLPSEALPSAAAMRLAVAYSRLPRVAHEGRHRARPARPSRPEIASTTVQSPAGEALARAQALYHDGKVFEALVLVDDTLEGLDGPNEPLRAQREAWRAERETLVAEYLDRAESALAVEDPETAYAWYARVLALDPGHYIALDRVHKIETLRRIRASRRS